jgi:hypothetical protein
MQQIQRILVEDYKNDIIKDLYEYKKAESIPQEVKDSIDESIKAVEHIGISTFYDLRIMIWIVYIIGLILIGLSIWNFLTTPDSSFVFLGMGSLGVADILITLFYNPANRLQKASSDATQHVMAQITYSFTRKLRKQAAEKQDPVLNKQLNDTADKLLNDLKVIMESLHEHLEIK